MLFKGIRLAVLLSGMLIFSPMTPAQIVLKHPGWEWRISETGCAEQLIFKNKQRMIQYLFSVRAIMPAPLSMLNAREKRYVRFGFRMDMLPIAAK